MSYLEFAGMPAVVLVKLLFRCGADGTKSYIIEGLSWICEFPAG